MADEAEPAADEESTAGPVADVVDESSAGLVASCIILREMHIVYNFMYV